MCFGCHFNICARHARGGAEEGSVAAGKEPSLAIVTETSIWATRVLASSKGDQKKRGERATRAPGASGLSSTSDRKEKKRGGIEEKSTLLPDRVDREREQVKAALSLEAKLPTIFSGKSPLIEQEASVGSESCHSKSRLVEDTGSSERNKSAKYFMATNLPKRSAGVDIV